MIKKKGTMIAEKNVTICGKEVAMRYCAAAETGYETISGQSVEVFVPEIEKDDDGNIVNIKQLAKASDYIRLAFAAIIAAYERKGEDSPVTAEDILYDASPTEVNDLILTVVKLRNEWYEVPKVIKPEFVADEKQEKGKKKKNATPPTTSSKR